MLIDSEDSIEAQSKKEALVELLNKLPGLLLHVKNIIVGDMCERVGKNKVCYIEHIHFANEFMP